LIAESAEYDFDSEQVMLAFASANADQALVLLTRGFPIV